MGTEERVATYFLIYIETAGTDVEAKEWVPQIYQDGLNNVYGEFDRRYPDKANTPAMAIIERVAGKPHKVLRQKGFHFEQEEINLALTKHALAHEEPRLSDVGQATQAARSDHVHPRPGKR